MISGQPLLSVIVPVYQVEKYLPKCIDSILNQTFPDFELLLIDDGSPDGCGAICDRYAGKDKRVRVFHKPNGGVSSARNTGLKHVCGEWILFIDSDDWIAKDMFGKIVEGIEQYPDIELVTFGVMKAHSSGKTEEMFKLGQSGGVADINSFQYNYSFYSCCYYTKKVKTYHLQFPEGIKYAEDQEFMIKYLAVCQEYYLLPDYFYYYLERGDSAMKQKRNAQNCIDHIKVCSNLVTFFTIHKIQVLHPCIVYAFRELIAAFYFNIIISKLSLLQLLACRNAYHAFLQNAGVYRDTISSRKWLCRMRFTGMLLCYFALYIKNSPLGLNKL